MLQQWSTFSGKHNISSSFHISRHIYCGFMLSYPRLNHH